MRAKELQRQLVRAILAANLKASVETHDGLRVHVGPLTIEIGADRIVVGPSTCDLTAEEVKLLGDPDSVLWFVARFDDPDFAGKLARYLQKRGMALPANWLKKK